MHKVLLIDDEPRILSGLRLLLRRDFDVEATSDPERVFEVLRHQHVSVLISDQRMPLIEGVEVLRKARDISPSTVRMLLTGYADTYALLSAVNEGEVYRYLQKPWDNQMLLAQVQEAAIASDRMLRSQSAEAANANTSVPSPLNVRSRRHRLAVLDTDRSSFELLRNMVLTNWIDCEIVECADANTLLATLAKTPTSVVLVDYQALGDAADKLLRFLKAEAPAIQILLAFKHFDTDLVARLANEVRPYRFVSKPYKSQLQTLRVYINAACSKYDSIAADTNRLILEKAMTHEQTVASDARIFGALGAQVGRWFRSAFARTS
jgi:response regulator RpfG family c-di-GMP phosphodiesterase